jgi:hypothetical protein
MVNREPIQSAMQIYQGAGEGFLNLKGVESKAERAGSPRCCSSSQKRLFVEDA